MDNIVLIGICGGSASGKTTIAQKLVTDNPNDVVLISQDMYYKPYDDLSIDEKKKVNYDHPDAFDIDLMVKHLIHLKNGLSINAPIYSFVEYTRMKESIKIEPKRVILLEGMLIFHYPEIRNLLDNSIYIESSENIRLKRMVSRDVLERGRTTDSVIEQYLRDMKPMHDRYVESLKQYADTLINGDFELDVVYNEFKEYLKENKILHNEEKIKIR